MTKTFSLKSKQPNRLDDGRRTTVDEAVYPVPAVGWVAFYGYQYAVILNKTQRNYVIRVDSQGAVRVRQGRAACWTVIDPDGCSRQYFEGQEEEMLACIEADARWRYEGVR